MFYAKSDPVETILEHTQELRIRYEQLKRDYGHLISDDVWKLLKIAVDYHDVGKAYGYFQMVIRKAMNMEYARHLGPNIPHNYLSPFFLPLDQFDLTPNQRKIVVQAIAYHHERNETFQAEVIEEIYEQELMPLFPLVAEHMRMEMNDGEQNIVKLHRYMKPDNRIDSRKSFETYRLYVMVKGLLHRLDHSASGHVEVECDAKVDLAQLTECYLQRNYGDRSLRDLQIFAKQNQNKNLIVIAQTGMGKTEAALLWAGNKKTFFTLPLRVSLNALYKRVTKDMEYQGAGLLHSSSASYLNEQNEDWEVIYDQSKHLSSKLLFTTIDQILKFPIKFKGYEKYYATIAYSAVVIDEIQAYEPKIAAILLKALEMIHKIGGKFMIMTATLPQLYLDYLNENKILHEGSDFVLETFVNEQRRHRISMERRTIDENVSAILEAGQQKKVLIIVNTVKKAVTLYNKFKDDGVRLLHSMFIQKHRGMLEKEIKNFDEARNDTGIWITTQVVEASIDIDFDELHTEAASLDSLFQRFGRCYRRRELDHSAPNIWIYTEDVSGKGSIYDEFIVDESMKLLEPYHKKCIREHEKVEMVRKLYSREALQNTKYLEQFDQAMKEVDAFLDFEYDEKQAQTLLRNIQAVQVIPRSEYNAHAMEIFEQLETEANKEKRQELRRKIEQYTVSIREYLIRNNPHLTSPNGHYGKRKDGSKYPILPHIFILESEYDFNEEELDGSGVSIDPSLSRFL